MGYLKNFKNIKKNLANEKQDTNKSGFFKKIGLITGVDALTKIIGYLLLPIYLSLMSQRDFGEFTFIFSTIAPISLVIGMSLYIPFIRNFCENSSNIESRKELVSTVFSSLVIWFFLIDISLLISKPFLIGIFSNLFGISIFVNEKYYLFILLLNTSAILLYCYSLLMSRQKKFEIVVFMGVKFFLVSIFSILFIFFNLIDSDSVLNRLLGICFAELVVSVTYIILIVRPYYSFSINFNLLKNQFKIALPLIPSGLIGLCIVIIDKSLITKYHGLNELAKYNLALMSLLPIQMLISSLQVAWAPHLFSLDSKKNSMKQTIQMMYLVFPIMVCSVLLLSFAIYLGLFLNLIKQVYVEVPMLIIYGSFGVMATSLIHFNSNMFVSLNRTHYQLIIALIILGINWSINLLLIPIYSFYGAVIASGLANTIGLIIGLLVLIRITNNINTLVK